MPPSPSQALQDGIRLERAGLLDKALQQFRAAIRQGDEAVVAEALRHEADVQRARCNWQSALEQARRSGAVARSAGRDDLVAEAMNAEAAVHLSRSDYDAARTLLLNMLDLPTDPRIRGIALQNLGLIAAERDDLDEAHRRFTESSACFEEAGYRRGVVLSLLNSSRLPLLRGRYAVAAEQAARAEAIAREIGDLELVALACLTLGEALLHLRRMDEAERCAVVAYGYFSGVGNDWRRVECLRLHGDLHMADSDPDSAVRCFTRALELAEPIGATIEMERLRDRLDKADQSQRPHPAHKV